MISFWTCHFLLGPSYLKERKAKGFIIMLNQCSVNKTELPYQPVCTPSLNCNSGVDLSFPSQLRAIHYAIGFKGWTNCATNIGHRYRAQTPEILGKKKRKKSHLN